MRTPARPALRRFILAVTVAASIGLQPAPAGASTITATSQDKAAFLDQYGATSATGPLPNLGRQDGPTATVKDVTFTIAGQATGIYVGTKNHTGAENDDWTTRLPGPDIGFDGTEDFNITLPAPVYAFGIDVVEPHQDPNVKADFVDSVFQLTLKSGTTTLGEVTFEPPNDTATFFGVASSQPFDTVEIRETTGGIENEFFGEVYTALQLPAAEPPTTTTTALPAPAPPPRPPDAVAPTPAPSATLPRTGGTALPASAGWLLVLAGATLRTLGAPRPARR